MRTFDSNRQDRRSLTRFSFFGDCQRSRSANPQRMPFQCSQKRIGRAPDPAGRFRPAAHHRNAGHCPARLVLQSIHWTAITKSRTDHGYTRGHTARSHIHPPNRLNHRMLIAGSPPRVLIVRSPPTISDRRRSPRSSTDRQITTDSITDRRRSPQGSTGRRRSPQSSTDRRVTTSTTDGRITAEYHRCESLFRQIESPDSREGRNFSGPR